MRRWIALLISMCMALSMAACQGTGGEEKSGTDGAKATEVAAVTTTEAPQVSNKDQALETVDQFMKCLSEGDIDHLGDYCTEDVMKELKVNELEESFTESFGSQDAENPYTPSEEASAALKNGVSTILKAVIDHYELGEVEGEDNQDSYDVPITIYVRDMNGTDSLDMNTIMSEIITEEDYTEIMKLTQEGDQNSMYDYMMVNILPRMFDKMSEEIAKVEPSPEEGSLTVEKQADGKWLITKSSGMNSMVPGTEGGTEGEEAAAESSTQQ